jgi:hypothetical protein
MPHKILLHAAIPLPDVAAGSDPEVSGRSYEVCFREPQGALPGGDSHGNGYGHGGILAAAASRRPTAAAGRAGVEILAASGERDWSGLKRIGKGVRLLRAPTIRPVPLAPRLDEARPMVGARRV